MSTISNYLNGSLLNKEDHELERPVCLISARQSNSQFVSKVWDYTIQKNMANSKDLVILNISVSQNFRIPLGAPAKLIHKHHTYSLGKDNQILLDSNLQLISKPDYLTHLQETLHQIVHDRKLKDAVLFIDGLQQLSLFQSADSVVEFVNNLNEIPAAFKQISILTAYITNNSVKSALEKLSTLILTVSNKLFQHLGLPYYLTSLVVRRYTGFSHEEEYIVYVSAQNSQLKAQKYKKPSQPEPQEQDLGPLGFNVIKTDKKKQEIDQMKKIIFPYLKVQQEGGCNKHGQSSCQSCACGGDEIVLDEEQEDEDDVDV